MEFWATLVEPAVVVEVDEVVVESELLFVVLIWPPVRLTGFSTTMLGLALMPRALSSGDICRLTPVLVVDINNRFISADFEMLLLTFRLDSGAKEKEATGPYSSGVLAK